MLAFDLRIDKCCQHKIMIHIVDVQIRVTLYANEGSKDILGHTAEEKSGVINLLSPVRSRAQAARQKSVYNKKF